MPLSPAAGGELEGGGAVVAADAAAGSLTLSPTSEPAQGEAGGTSQAELAKKIHTSQQSISRIEAGEQNTSVAILRKIGQALGMDLHIDYKPKGLKLKHA